MKISAGSWLGKACHRVGRNTLQCAWIRDVGFKQLYIVRIDL